MLSNIVEILGLICVVAAAYLVSLPLALLVLGLALIAAANFGTWRNNTKRV